MKEYYTYQKENARSLESMGVNNGVTIPDILQRFDAWCKSWARDMRTKDAVAAFVAFASMFALVLALGVAKLAGCY